MGRSKKVRVMTWVFKKSSIVKKIPRQKWRKCVTLQLWCLATKPIGGKFRNHVHGAHDLTLNSQAFEFGNTHHTESQKSAKLTETCWREGMCKYKENKNKKHNITTEQVHGELIAQMLVAKRSPKEESLSAKTLETPYTMDTGGANVSRVLKVTSHEVVAAKQEQGVTKQELLEARGELLEERREWLEVERELDATSYPRWSRLEAPLLEEKQEPCLERWKDEVKTLVANQELSFTRKRLEQEK